MQKASIKCRGPHYLANRVPKRSTALPGVSSLQDYDRRARPKGKGTVAAAQALENGQKPRRRDRGKNSKPLRGMGSGVQRLIHDSAGRSEFSRQTITDLVFKNPTLRLHEGCEVCGFRAAAAVRLPGSTTTTRQRRCRRSIPTPMPMRHRCQLNKVCSNRATNSEYRNLTW